MRWIYDLVSEKIFLSFTTIRLKSLVQQVAENTGCFTLFTQDAGWRCSAFQVGLDGFPGGDQAQQVFVKFSGMLSFGRGTANHTQVFGFDGLNDLVEPFPFVGRMDFTGNRDDVVEWGNHYKPSRQGKFATQAGAFGSDGFFEYLYKNIGPAIEYFGDLPGLYNLGFYFELRKIESVGRFIVDGLVGEFEDRPYIGAEIGIMEKASFQNQRLQKQHSGRDPVFLLFPDTGRPRRNWHQLFSLCSSTSFLSSSRAFNPCGAAFIISSLVKNVSLFRPNFMEGNLSIRASAARIGWMTQVYICAGTGIAAQLVKKRIISSDGSS